MYRLLQFLSDYNVQLILVVAILSVCRLITLDTIYNLQFHSNRMILRTF